MTTVITLTLFSTRKQHNVSRGVAIRLSVNKHNYTRGEAVYLSKKKHNTTVRHSALRKTCRQYLFSRAW